MLETMALTFLVATILCMPNSLDLQYLNSILILILLCREFLREIKSDKCSEMILSTALLVVGPI